MISDAIRERYLRDSLPVRLGGLAADLARIASFSDNAVNHRAVSSLLEEGKYFAEWAAPDAPLDIQTVLASIQVTLALWERRWVKGTPEPLMPQEASRWADQLLRLAGLI